MAQLPGADLTVSDLCLGGSVFGCTADEPTSFAVLDRFLDATPSTLRPIVDTAASCNAGRSEHMIGDWMASRGVRYRVLVATKAARTGKEHPLGAAEIRSAAERSLRDLQVDTIDLYYAHWARPDDAARGVVTRLARCPVSGARRELARSTIGWSTSVRSSGSASSGRQSGRRAVRVPSMPVDRPA